MCLLEVLYQRENAHQQYTCKWFSYCYMLLGYILKDDLHLLKRTSVKFLLREEQI